MIKLIKNLNCSDQGSTKGPRTVRLLFNASLTTLIRSINFVYFELINYSIGFF